MFTRAWKLADQAEQRQRFEANRDCVRRVIFAVEDHDLKCRLIRLTRQFDDLDIASVEKQLQVQIERLENLKRGFSLGQMLTIAGFAAGFPLFGWTVAGPMGGCAAAVGTISFILFLVPELYRRTDAEIQKTCEKITELRGQIETIANLELFSVMEEETGNVLCQC